MAPSPSPRRSSGGGVLIAMGAIGGAVVGFVTGEPTVGLLAGTALGIAGALFIWWRERG